MCRTYAAGKPTRARTSPFSTAEPTEPRLRLDRDSADRSQTAAACGRCDRTPLTPKKGGQCKTKAKYYFKLSGKTLTFTPIKDTCTARRDVLTFGPWTKIG